MVAKSVSGSHRFSYNDNCYFVSFPFFAKKKEKKQEQRKGKERKGKLAIIMNESSETTFPNLPFTVFYKTRHPEKI